MNPINHQPSNSLAHSSQVEEAFRAMVPGRPGCAVAGL